MSVRTLDGVSGYIIRSLTRKLIVDRLLLEITGDINATLFLGQILFWSSISRREDGAFWKSDKAFAEELKLSRSQQERCRNIIEKTLPGAVKSEVRLAPSDENKTHAAPTRWYLVDYRKLESGINRWLNDNRWALKGDEDFGDDGEMDFAPKKPKRQPAAKSEETLALERLEKQFANALGILPPDWKRSGAAANKLWRMPLKEILRQAGGDELVAQQAVIDTLKYHKMNRLSVSSPRSIEKTVVDWFVAKANGQPAPYKVVKGRTAFERNVSDFQNGISPEAAEYIDDFLNGN